MTQLAMIIDLRKCIGCGTCSQICSIINKTPQSRKIIEKNIFENTSIKRLFVPCSCMHCQNAPCLKVCPTSATKKSKDGIVYIDHQSCIGCHACILACPYKARSVAESDSLPTISEHAGTRPSDPNNNRIGLPIKCDLCRDRIEAAYSCGCRPGDKLEFTPLCVQHCIAQALTLIDLDDPDNELQDLREKENVVQIRVDLCTEPVVYYIAD